MLRALRDPELSVVVRDRRILRYESADATLDRPGHVRAASSVAWIGSRLAIVQDDANFVAFVDPRGGPHAWEADSYALEAGEGGLRQFDEQRGNKKHKLDLEACVAVSGRLIAFGSGSTSRRERILSADADMRDVRLFDAHALYAALRAREDFAGSELNLEGATLVPTHRVGDGGLRVRLFQRGNGAPRGALVPLDATCDIPAEELLSYLHGGFVPAIDAVTAYDLGTVGGVRLTFTDAATVGERVFYLAAAEASPDTYRDGPVAGVAIGVLGDVPRFAEVRTADGAVFDAKAEGLAFDPNDPRRGWVVIDRDDPKAAAEIWSFELLGPW